MPARAPPFHLSQPVTEPGIPLPPAGPAPRELYECSCDRVEPVQARAALPCALVGEILRDPRGLDDPARARGKREDRTSTERGTGLPEARVGEREPVHIGRRDPAAEVTADQERRQRPRGPARGVEQVVER